jgi:hypothetical protein
MVSTFQKNIMPQSSGHLKDGKYIQDYTAAQRKTAAAIFITMRTSNLWQHKTY